MIDLKKVAAAPHSDLVRGFAQINQQIERMPDDPNVDKEELKETVKKIEAEVKKKKSSDPRKVERWLKLLEAMAEDIYQVTKAMLTSLEKTGESNGTSDHHKGASPLLL